MWFFPVLGFALQEELRVGTRWSASIKYTPTLFHLALYIYMQNSQ